MADMDNEIAKKLVTEMFRTHTTKTYMPGFEHKGKKYAFEASLKEMESG